MKYESALNKRQMYVKLGAHIGDIPWIYFNYHKHNSIKNYQSSYFRLEWGLLGVL